MRARTWETLTLILLGAAVGACTDDSPAKPANRSPVISSLTVFPDTIGLNDSAIVVCIAADPDADAMAYDWITDGRLDIKGALPGTHFLYNTGEPSRVFYTGFVDSPIETAWVQCYARDGRGKSANRLITVIIRQ